MRVYLSSTTSAWCRRPVSIRGPSGHEPDALPLSYVGLVPSTRVERATTAASRPRLFHWATRACSRQGPFRFAGADGCNPLTRPAVAPRPGFEPSSPHPECGVLPNRRPGNGGRRAADSPAGDQRCTSWATGAGLRRLRHHPLGGSRVPDLLLRRRLSPWSSMAPGAGIEPAFVPRSKVPSPLPAEHPGMVERSAGTDPASSVWKTDVSAKFTTTAWHFTCVGRTGLEPVTSWLRTR